MRPQTLSEVAALTQAGEPFDFALRGFLDQVFDFPAISRFVLGPYWNSANEEQRREFARDLFAELHHKDQHNRDQPGRSSFAAVF